MIENLVVDFTYTNTHFYLLKEMCNRDEPTKSNGMVVAKHQWPQASDLIRNNLAVWNKSRDDPYVRIRITDEGVELWNMIQKNR